MLPLVWHSRYFRMRKINPMSASTRSHDALTDQFIVPQYILDSLILSGRGSEASIIVTQPRRLAAISVAKRVSSERLDDGSVGYAVRGETRSTERTKLLFCTTGVALRRMASDELQGISHIVVDEVGPVYSTNIIADDVCIGP
jgi:hypothetical protein